MNGTWQTTGGGGPAVGLVAVAAVAAVVGAAAAAWILTKVLLIVLILVALLVIAVMVILVVRRIRHPEGAVQLARTVAALRADAELQAVETRPAAGVHYHGGTHLHIEAGADAAAVLRQADLLRTDVHPYPPVDP
jgi:type VI protein secretion system component VasK